MRRALRAKYALPEEVFIGEVDTQPFLAQNISRYLFAGGVGQVILEAGQLGYPCLVCGVRGPGVAFFAARNVFAVLRACNCSPFFEEHTGFFSADIRRAEEAFRLVRSGQTERFALADEINRTCALATELEKYGRIIFGGK